MSVRKLLPEPISSRVAIFGHPLHPVLIHFPVAALIALVATDLAYVATGDEFWARAGLWLAGVGACGGWISGLAGVIDLGSVRRIRRLITAWCHGIFAVMLLSLASWNWLLRIGDPVGNLVPLGLTVSLLSAPLIAITGFLGGQLVYEYAIGVDTDEAAKAQDRAGN